MFRSSGGLGLPAPAGYVDLARDAGRKYINCYDLSVDNSPVELRRAGT